MTSVKQYRDIPQAADFDNNLKMASTNVEYYEKMKDLQEKQHDSEKKRMDLEQQLNNYMKSDQRLARLKAVRLQNYWKKICDDEKRSQWRNEQLLKDFDRVESHMATLSEKTQKLSTMKRQYEEYIDRTYPNWRQILVQKQEFKQQERRRRVAEEAAAAAVQAARAALPAAHQTPSAAYHYPSETDFVSLAPPQRAVPAESTLNSLDREVRGFMPPAAPPVAPYQPASAVPHLVDKPELVASRVEYPQGVAAQPLRLDDAAGVHPGDLVDGVPTPIAPAPAAPAPAAPQAQPAPKSTPRSDRTPGYVDMPNGSYRISSTLPAGMSINVQDEVIAGLLCLPPQGGDRASLPAGQPPAGEPPAREALTAGGLGGEGRPDGQRRPQRGDRQAEPRQVPLPAPALQRLRDDPGEQRAMSPGEVLRPLHKAGEGALALGSTLQTVSSLPSGLTLSSETEMTVDQPLVTPGATPPSAGPGERHIEGAGVEATSASRGTRAVEDFEEDNSRDFSDIDSPRRSRENNAAKSPDPGIRVRSPDPDSMYLQPDVTLDGLYNMLTTLEHRLPETTDQSDLYRGAPPGESVKKDIIQHAQKGALLSHLDAGSISLVVLDQLPLLVDNLEESCLIPDKVLYKPTAGHTAETLRNYIHPTSVGLWDRIQDHFLYLLKYEVMSASQMADVFAPLLIAEDSPYESQAIQVLSEVLQNADTDLLQTAASTSTFSTIPSLSPRKHKAREPTVPPLHLENEKEEEEEEGFFGPAAPKGTGPVTMSQTAAYKQFLGGTVTSQKSDALDDDSDSSDNIENQLISGATPRKHSNSYQAPPKDSPPEASDGRGGAVGAVTSHDADDVTSGAESSPDAPSAGVYIPSAMGDAGKSLRSTTSQGSSTGLKKTGPAFHFGDSDTDEDVAFPGTQPAEGAKHDPVADDDDDFFV